MSCVPSHEALLLIQTAHLHPCMDYMSASLPQEAPCLPTVLLRHLRHQSKNSAPFPAQAVTMLPISAKNSTVCHGTSFAAAPQCCQVTERVDHPRMQFFTSARLQFDAQKCLLSTPMSCVWKTWIPVSSRALSLVRHPINHVFSCIDETLDVSDNCLSRVCKGAVLLQALTHELCHTAFIISQNTYT